MNARTQKAPRASPREGPAAAKQLGRNAVPPIYRRGVSGMRAWRGARLDRPECNRCATL